MTARRSLRHRLTLRTKVVLVATAASMIGFFAAGLGLVRIDARQTRASINEELVLIATSVANDARSAMMFEDSDSARDALATLRAYPELRRAVLIDVDGRTVATMPPTVDPAWRPEPNRPGRLTVSVPVELDGMALGTLAIEAGEGRLAARRRAFAVGLATATLLGLAVSIVAAWSFHRLVSRPLNQLAAAARRIRRSPAAGATVVQRHADDELGQLTDEINGMLAEIRDREARLREAMLRAEAEADRARAHASETERASDTMRAEIVKRRSLQEQLLHSQRMELLGQMAGGVAHDVNNALTVIVGWADIVRAGGKIDGLEHILAAADQASRITRQLLAFSRKGVAALERVDANLVVRRIHELASPIIGESVELRCELDPSDPCLLADQGQLEQVLMNLVVNARDALGDGGTITIRTTADRVPSGELLASFGADPRRRYTELVVEDDGPGVPDELRERIFEPFFTTKDVGRGTGLGLAVCYGIVSSHGGALVLDSEPGRGSAFRLFLPQSEAKPEVTEPGRLLAASSRTSACVLIVEDEVALRSMLVEVLRSDGMSVREAADGQEALETIAAEGDAIDLVVSDMRMPRMGGAALHRAATSLAPTLPFLLMSGYHEEQLRDLGDGSAVRFMAKPFRPAELRAAVCEMLAERERASLGVG